MQSRLETGTDFQVEMPLRLFFLYDFLGYVFPVGYFILRLAFVEKW